MDSTAIFIATAVGIFGGWMGTAMVQEILKVIKEWRKSDNDNDRPTPLSA